MAEIPIFSHGDFFIKSMKPAIKNILDKYEYIKKELSLPKNISNIQKCKSLNQELKTMNGVMEKISELQEVENYIHEARDVIETSSDSDLVSIAQTELNDYMEKAVILETEIENKMKVQDPLDKKNIIIEVRAGTGGEESALFAADLFRMYSRFSENKGWALKLLSTNRTDLGGYKEIIFEIIGDGAYGYLKYESGTHRVQRIPETEKSGRVHTSAATVAVFPEAEEVDFAVNPSDLKIDLFRAGGHGGQNVNKTETAIRITHLPTNTVVVCRDERSQQQNRAKAMTVLRSRLLAAHREKQANEQSKMRKKQIGTGDRSEKIRTYNFPQDRITDHRIKKSWHNINKILDGDLEPITQELKKAEEAIN